MDTLELPKTEIATIAERIDHGLVAFEERKEHLTQLQKKAHGLKIESLEDQVAITAVSTIRKELKFARVEIEKEGKAMRDPLTRLSKHILSKESELVAIIQPTEKELQEQELWVEGEKEKLRLAAEEAEKARIQARIDNLAAFGFGIDYATIAVIDESSFEKVLANAEIEYKKEQEAIAEKLRLEEIEKKRLDDERKELEELRKKQAEAQAIIDAENLRIKREHEAKEAALLAEQKRLEKQALDLQLQKEKEEHDRIREIEMKKAREEAAEKARLQAIEEARLAAAEKERQLQADKTEAERQASLRPDKEKLQSFSDLFSTITLPVVANENAQAIINEVQVMIGKMQAHILKRIKSL